MSLQAAPQLLCLQLPRVCSGADPVWALAPPESPVVVVAASFFVTLFLSSVANSCIAVWEVFCNFPNLPAPRVAAATLKAGC